MSSPKYIPGDFWRICDRCGFKKRASETFRTWDGLFVCREDWETRHPQDFVRGRMDIQNVPNPRPEGVNNVGGPLITTISAAASAGATTISVDSSTRFQPTDKIGIILDNGNTEANTVSSVPNATSLIVTIPIGGAASVGNIVIDYSAVASVNIG